MNIRLILFSFLTLFPFLPLHAQEEEDETPPQVIQPDNEMILVTERRADINKYKYHLGIDGNFSFGNVNRTLFATRTSLDVDVHKKIRLSTSPFFIYGRYNKILNERELFGDIRSSFWYSHQIHPISFISFEKSNLRKIGFRSVYATGFSYKLLDKAKAKISVTDFILYESSDYIKSVAFADRRLWRNATKLQGEYKINKDKFILSHLINVQPAITQDNIRWNANLNMRYMLSKQISFRMILEDYYESLVVPGRKRNDFRLMFGLGWDGGK